MSHTPGNWKHLGWSDEMYPATDEHVMPIKAEFVGDDGNKHHLFICYVFDYPQRGRIEAEANARLIAAAPDLLEALLDVERQILPFGRTSERVRAALAKARGIDIYAK